MEKNSTKKYQIHPAIAVARVGDSPNSFYLAPEGLAQLPIECDDMGNPKKSKTGEVTRVSSFKDSNQRVRRQGARFGIYVIDEKHPHGRPIKVGDKIEGIGSSGRLVDIEWTVWLANKKSSWYQFQQLEGEHGYADDHTLRNAAVTDTGERQKMLIIDPGPQSINCTKTRKASFAKGENPDYAQTFPPPLKPNNIDTLGDILSNDSMELVVLGGHGNSGCYLDGPDQPRVEGYANNDGWFDDTSDGPVTAKLIYADERDNQYRYMDVEDPSWVVVGYPRFAPQLADIITMDDVLVDVNTREFGSNQYLYGVSPFDSSTYVDVSDPNELEDWRSDPRKEYNENYYPYFYRDIWPILERPNAMQWVTDVLVASNLPHDTSADGTFDPNKIGVPPKTVKDPKLRAQYDYMRMFIYKSIRPHDESNTFKFEGRVNGVMTGYPLMPYLAGDNPISNTVPSKFITLTETQIFLLKQWAKGKFINENEEKLTEMDQEQKLVRMDKGGVENVAGGAFNPGAEVSWIIRNPAIYNKPYRIKTDPNTIPGMANSTVGTTPGVNTQMFENMLSLSDNFAVGLQPGDITKRSALPWQTDFNECTSQDINVTYKEWNKIYPDSVGDDFMNRYQETTTALWWPVHRPMQVYRQNLDSNGNPIPGTMDQVNWSRGIPQTYEGDLKMVTAWKDMGFVIQAPSDEAVNPNPFLEQERNYDFDINDQYSQPVKKPTKKSKK